MTHRVGPLVVGLVLFAFWAGAASASAATLYVATTGFDGSMGSNDCLDEAHPCKTIRHGLEKAGTADVVSVAEGTYAESSSIGKAATIVGHGAGTVLEPSTSLQSPIFTAGHDLDLQNLRLVSGNEGAVIDVEEAETHLTLSNVVAEQTASPTKEAAIDLAGSTELLTVEGSTISGQDRGTIYAARHATVEVRGSTVDDAPGGKGAIEVEKGTLRVEGSTVTGTVGVVADASVAALLHDLIETTGVGVTELGGSNLTLRDSLVAPPAGEVQPRAVVLVASGAEELSVVGSTLYATDPDEAPVALEIGSANGSADVNVANSILATGPNPGAIDVFNEGAPATVSISHSSFTSSGGNGVPLAGSGTNVAVAPVFANQEAGDFRLSEADGPLLDAGDPSQVTAGETDLAGAARIVDGNCDGVAAPDLGAYEFVRTESCPPPGSGIGTGGGGASSGSGGDTGSGGSPGAATGGGGGGGAPSHGGGKKSAPKISGLSVKETKAGPVLKFSVSEASKVKVAVVRAVTRRVRGHRKTSYKTIGTAGYVARKAGSQTVHLPARFGSAKLAAGHYGVVLSAVAAGVHSPDRTARFSVA